MLKGQGKLITKPNHNNMKIQHLLLTVIAAAAFVIVGCSKSGSVDTSKLTTAFQSAEAGAKTAVDSVTTAVKNGDYSGAVVQLKALGNKYKLTPEQQQAVNDLIAQVKNILADTAAKSTGDASKAATDMGNAIKK